MNIERVEQIKESLKGIGTNPSTGYTNQEIIDKLIELEKALLAGVYEKNHAENMRPQDLTTHFALLAEEFALDESDAYQRFLGNMDELDHTVKSLIAGQKGERLAKNSLRPLAFDQDVRVLYNITLGNESMKTEYDAIVIAPYGLFAVEVKNWTGDVTLTKDGFLAKNGGNFSTNLAARMLVKETLLREYLDELFPANYSGVLLFPEDKTRFRDDYRRIPVGYGAGVSNSIRFSEGTRVVLSPEQVSTIAERLSSANLEQHTLCLVKCDEIIDDFATLMAQMESASIEEERKEALGLTVDATITVPDSVAGLVEKGKEIISNINWDRVKSAALFTVGFTTTFAITQIIRNKHK